MKFKLNEKLKMILLEGPKYQGTYKYPDALGPFEEQMTGEEHEAAEAFLGWLLGKGLHYGHGNLEQRWKEWQKEASGTVAKVLAVVLALSLFNASTVVAGDVGYWPETKIPDIKTFAELRKYEKARKAAITGSVLGAIASGVLITYAGQVDRKARRVNIYYPGIVTSPGLPPSYFARPEQVDFQRRLQHKAELHQGIGIAMALLSVFGFSLSMSLRF